MLVQVYVDDIIFGSTKRSWCDEFEALMKSRFQMSSMGELTFFLGLQVKQKEDVCACSRFQVTPKTSHLNDVKRIFRKSTTGEAEYVAAANCCGQVLWIQNQMLDYGFNFMNTKIYMDNESTICIVKNLVQFLEPHLLQGLELEMGVVAQCELQFKVYEKFGCEVEGVGWGSRGVAEPSPSCDGLCTNNINDNKQY
ncbi:putative ribonuclease H-like domain-containing protein [Tanacetum coccineum]